MSHENVEIVRRVVDAYLGGDFTAALAAHHPEVEFDATVRPEGRVFRGREGVAEGMRVWTGAWVDYRMEIEDLIDAGDHVLVITRESGRGKTSGMNIAQQSFGLFTLRDGQIIRWKVFLARGEAFAAAGLSERAMSDENVEEVVRASVAAFQARDVEAWVDCFHPSAELLLPRNVLEGGGYLGHEGVRQALADAYETWEDIRIEIAEVRPAGNLLVALGRATNVGKAGAPAVEFESAYIVKMRDGKIAYFHPYQSHREALEAAGMSE